ncbi:hypothetical protein [Sphingobacterium multivorum]|uniref:hypothetical protein n=1 Tax=Sphingobacterium multivorum TaxID=28454 RepID=UPI0028AA5D15|nr:hypothetical protein [Sphingobacterium multivorum]
MHLTLSKKENIMAKQSKARKQSLDFLDNLGTDQSEFREVSDGLESVCGNFIKRVIDNINSFDLIDTGAISDLSMTVISPTEIHIEGQSYINFIDQGVNGVNATPAPLSPYKYRDKMPDPAIFKTWILSKNIKVRNTRYNTGQGEDKVFDVDDKDIDSVAYAMAKSRFLNGQEPKPIFQKEIPQLIKDATAVVGQITIDNIFSNLNLK